MNTPRAPLIVVGAGIAGLSAALAAAPHPVLLLSRTRPVRDVSNDAATALAQGGIAAALAATDSAAAHGEDTLIAGAHHNDREAVRYLCGQAPHAIDWLRQLGVDFDCIGDSDGLDLGREGGHRCARIVHAGGDATGARVLWTYDRIGRLLTERTLDPAGALTSEVRYTYDRSQDSAAAYSRGKLTAIQDDAGRLAFDHDARGRIVSFGGRAMDPQARAKYLNGPETELFDKGRNLFNHAPAKLFMNTGSGQFGSTCTNNAQCAAGLTCAR